MADFGGWEMPIEYPPSSGGGVINEHTAVRDRVGLFDVSHLGKAEISGVGAREFLNSVLTNDLSKIAPGQAQYSMICEPESGGVIDDVIVYLHSDEEILMVPNAANNAEVVRLLQQSAPKGINVSSAHEKYGVIALQGPLAKEILNSLGIEIDLSYMSFTKTRIGSHEVIVCRTGYTGESGYEILPLWNESLSVWNLLVVEVEKRGGTVAGLGARDTLRTEMGYPLHGHELSRTITPVEAGASWAVGWQKESFWGASRLRTQKEDGTERVLRAVVLADRGIPRADMNVVDANGTPIGIVTSGTFSPTLKKGIALALISREFSIGAKVGIDVRGRTLPATIEKLPLVPSRVK